MSYSKWDQTIDFKNKRVAVIGTGASAIQVVPEIQKSGCETITFFNEHHLGLFLELIDVLAIGKNDFLHRFPIIQKFIRSMVYWVREAYCTFIYLSFTYSIY